MVPNTNTVAREFDLTMDELRGVAHYVVQHAEDVLSVFEQTVPDDPRCWNCRGSVPHRCSSAGSAAIRR